MYLTIEKERQTDRHTYKCIWRYRKTDRQRVRQMSLFISRHHFPPLYPFVDDSLPDQRNSQGRDFQDKPRNGKIIRTKNLFIRLCIFLRSLHFLELCACNWISEQKQTIFFLLKIFAQFVLRLWLMWRAEI